jgi:hypothetical protein
MRTIGTRRPKSSPRGDVEATCDICGAHWLMSKMRVGADGLLHCPDEGGGMDRVECAQADADDVRGHVDKRGYGSPSKAVRTVDI